LQIVPYQLFATADGWLVLAVGNDGQWQRFCQSAGRADLAADPRFATNTLRVHNRDLLIPLLEDVFRAVPTAQWQERLLAVEIPHAPLWDYAQVFAHPQAAARGLRVTVRDPEGRPVDLVGTPFHLTGATLPPPSLPPTLGQDTDAVLHELLGLEADRLAELRRRKVIE
jgi:crotonobetainyl-CoA:carnitine CoA-transferase CaiB-like acyl-CoA transferase